MTPEKIITSATITTGEKHDGKELINLIEKSENNGIEVEAIIGDGAYSEKENLNYCNENEIKNVSKLSKMVTHGNSKRNDNFEYNKDAGMHVCKAGHMAILKKSREVKNQLSEILESRHIILTWKNVNIVLLKMDVITKVQKQKHIV